MPQNGYLIKHENKIGLFGKNFTPLCSVQKQEKKILINARFTDRQFNMYLKDMLHTQVHWVQYSEKQVFFFLLILQDLHVLPSLPLFAQISCLKTNNLWIRVRSRFEFQIGHSNQNTTFTLLICTWFLKNRVCKIKLDELGSWSISNLNFAGYTGSKNQVWNRPKIRYLKKRFGTIHIPIT